MPVHIISETWCAKVCWSWKQSSFFFFSRLGAYNSRNVQRLAKRREFETRVSKPSPNRYKRFLSQCEFRKYFTTTHFVSKFRSPKWACPLRRTKCVSEVSNREIVASLRDNRYSYGSVYVFGYTTSWMSRLALSGLAIKIRGYFRPPRWVIVNKIATLRDDRHIRTSAYVFGYTTSWITRSACFVFAFRKLYAPA